MKEGFQSCFSLENCYDENPKGGFRNPWTLPCYAPALPAGKCFDKWDIDDVCSWLVNNKLEEHRDAFKQNKVRGLAEKRLGDKYKSEVRAMPYNLRIEAVWSKGKYILKTGNLKSPKDSRERKLPAWGSLEPQLLKQRKTPDFLWKGRENRKFFWRTGPPKQTGQDKVYISYNSTYRRHVWHL